MHTEISRHTAGRCLRHLAIIATAGLVLASAARGDEDCDETCQKLREAQDPLAPVTAIMTDNTIGFGTSPTNSTFYGFQVQPVYTIKTERGYNFIARGTLPIVGVDRGAFIPFLGPDPVIALPGETAFGLSDTVIQGFFVPKTESSFKVGFGPQVSLKTRTNKSAAGPGFGLGLAAVGFGFVGDLSYGALLNHHWGGEDNYSLTTLQPIVFYNLPLFGGSYIGYNNSITYNWPASSGNRWQVPLGLTAGKTFLFESGYSFDVSVGAYELVVRPDGGADWQIKFAFNLFFP